MSTCSLAKFHTYLTTGMRWDTWSICWTNRVAQRRTFWVTAFTCLKEDLACFRTRLRKTPSPTGAARCKTLISSASRSSSQPWIAPSTSSSSPTGSSACVAGAARGAGVGRRSPLAAPAPRSSKRWESIPGTARMSSCWAPSAASMSSSSLSVESDRRACRSLAASSFSCAATTTASTRLASVVSSPLSPRLFHSASRLVHSVSAASAAAALDSKDSARAKL
mmetsp:Transcript_29773/g.67479  ORF Transcript_29773/g.67479 Transcript_29773/m.67479 type:complete len:222 (-) Transcript_29773:18-683(-)